MAGTVAELAWSAGFVEGEGCWYSTKNGNNTSYPRFTISQVDPQVLNRFRDAVGVGTVRGPRFYKDRPNNRPCYEYTIWGLEKVQAVTAMLWSFLGPIKRAQATRVLLATGKEL